MEKKKFSTKQIALIGVLSALVFAATYLHIDIPTALGKTMIHFGNVVCLLGGLLFGPVTGGLSAGIGSALPRGCFCRGLHRSHQMEQPCHPKR